jgi:hypothetical protein
MEPKKQIEASIQAVRIDDFKIRITKTEVPVVTEHEYDINFLLQQKKNIQAQKDAFDAARDAELKEVEELLQHCSDQGIVEKPVEEIKPSPAPVEEIQPVPIDNIKPAPIVVKPKKEIKTNIFTKIVNWFKKS